MSAGVMGAGAAESLEGLEETLDLVGRYGRASVRDRQEGVAVAAGMEEKALEFRKRPEIYVPVND